LERDKGKGREVIVGQTDKRDGKRVRENGEKKGKYRKGMTVEERNNFAFHL
jgi:hypothetical protein